MVFRLVLFCSQLYLYGKETKAVSFSEFVNRELILFSNMDNERSIPCLVDGKYQNVITSPLSSLKKRDCGINFQYARLV